MDNQPQTQMPQKSENQMQKFILGMFLGLFLIITILLILNSLNVISLSSLFSKKRTFSNENISQNPANTFQNNVPASQRTDGIARVGEEILYQKDLDTEVQYSPDTKGDKKKFLLDKMIKDSIILQAGQKEGLVRLDASIYNSPQKDYMKRIKAVSDVTKKVEDNRGSVSGYVVSIWFSNNGPWKLPYDTAKEIAFKKITYLHQEVEAKRMTMEQAGEEIKKDASLFDVDRAYKTNALFTFNTGTNEKITFDSEFDTILRNLAINQVSNVYVGKDIEIKNGKKTGNMIEALYMFGQVTKKNNDATYTSFDEWYDRYKSQYETVIY